MRILSSIIIGAALLSAAASANAPDRAAKAEARLARALEGRVAGKPVDCITQSQIQSTEVIPGIAILYRTSGNRIYVNRPDSGQSSLGRDDILVTRTSSSQLCSIDTIRLLDRTSHIEHGFIGLGKFVPYTRVQSKG